MTRVAQVVLVAVRQVHHRRAAHVREERRVGGCEEVLEEDALAEAGVGGLELVGADQVHQRGEHDGAAEDHVAAVGLDARHLPALLGRQLRELLDQFFERVSREQVALGVRLRQAGAALGGGGEVADSAADSSGARRSLIGRAQPIFSLELGLHVLAERLHLLRARAAVVGEKGLAHPHGAELP